MKSLKDFYTDITPEYDFSLPGNLKFKMYKKVKREQLQNTKAE